jgi:FAD/FMN-containing dehydrogenase/Fe-S oxidoreductase
MAGELKYLDARNVASHWIRRRQVNIEDVPDLDVGARELAEKLARSIEGEVRFGNGDRALYATDASNYRQVPIGVVIPKNIEDVVRTVALARQHGAPVLPRGCGTSLGGQCCNVAVVIDFTKYLDRIVELDVEHGRARVQPGVVLDSLRDDAERFGLTFGPDTSTHAYCTMGGMIGNNSCGVRSVMSQFRGPGSRTSDHVHELDILLYDGTRMRVGRTSEEELERIIRGGGRKGEIYGRLRDLRDRYADRIRERYPKLSRRVSGYNLDELLPENGFHVARALAGTEGTCALTLEATLRLEDNPPVRYLVILGFDSIFEAGDRVPDVMEHEPTGVEGIDQKLVDNMRKKGLQTEHLKVLPEGHGWLFVEFGGKDVAQAREYARSFVEATKKWRNPPTAKIIDSWEDAHKAWLVREAGLPATANIPGEDDHFPGWEDSAVPADRVGDYYREIAKLYEKYGYDSALYGHIGQGVLHTRTDFDLYTAGGIDDFKRFTREAAELVTRFGGSLSGEHGDGQARGDLLPIMFGEELVEAFREFKEIWDPDWKMNPGKVVRPNPRDSSLRLGTAYDPWKPKTHFRFPEDDGSFARATLRCVGVGKCRVQAGGTMCPSFQVLREEEHTTRGRAHLLFEMLHGDSPVRRTWKNEPVKEALDLCLSCKGCKGDCPVNVDVATYKAEFMSHYYEGRVRPRAAYAFGLIEWWSRLATLAPDTANLLTQTPGLDRVAKWVAGIDPRRRVPAFAPQTFRGWWRSRELRNPQGRRVVLWPDVFNDHFFPSILQAGAEVLEHAGCRVELPQRWLASGRPLYEFGMLDLAKWQLSRILAALREEIRAGTPVIALEPSVASVFRDELTGLFPDDEDAQRLKRQTFTLGEFLLGELDGYKAPKLEGKAFVHGHCHHKAVLGFAAEPTLLQRMGLEVDVPHTGCCGMAGAFGFEAGEKYEIAVARGEQMLLPAVRGLKEDTLIIADGFSCREQIVQATDRRPLHTAEVIQLALRRPKAAQWGKRPELQQARLRDPALARPTSPLLGAAALGGALILAGTALRGIGQIFEYGNHGRNHEDQAAARRRAAHLGAGSRAGRGRGPRADLVRREAGPQRGAL